jgi:protein-tyrosine phosphatase
LYIIANDYYAARNGRILRAITAAQPGGILFHCHSGKDRTGITAALLLSLAGVEREAIGADHALTQKMLWPRFQRWVREQGGVEKIDRWSTPITEPETMLETLAYLDDTYEGIEEYLLQAGQTPEEISRLKSILT